MTIQPTSKGYNTKYLRILGCFCSLCCFKAPSDSRVCFKRSLKYKQLNGALTAILSTYLSYIRTFKKY